MMQQNPNMENSNEQLISKAKAGDSFAQFQVGLKFYFGADGFDQDYTKVFKFKSITINIFSIFFFFSIILLFFSIIFFSKHHLLFFFSIFFCVLRKKICFLSLIPFKLEIILFLSIYS